MASNATETVMDPVSEALDIDSAINEHAEGKRAYGYISELSLNKKKLTQAAKVRPDPEGDLGKSGVAVILDSFNWTGRKADMLRFHGVVHQDTALFWKQNKSTLLSGNQVEFQFAIFKNLDPDKDYNEYLATKKAAEGNLRGGDVVAIFIGEQPLLQNGEWREFNMEIYPAKGSSNDINYQSYPGTQVVPKWGTGSGTATK
jgi:hypothetical protein